MLGIWGVMKGIIIALIFVVGSDPARGDADGLYRQGLAVFQENPEKACKLFVQAAEAGNVSAMAGAGHCYETGTGTAVDYAKAIEWYERAVSQNSLKACEGLARIYASCSDPEFHDGEKAVKYATPGVRKRPRDAEALGLLAVAYARNFEFEKAVVTGTKALRNSGDIETAKKMRVRLDCLKAGQPEPALATEIWYFQAADKNATWAMVEMAHRYADRDGNLYNAGNAIQMFRKAIKAGRTDLLYLLGNVYFYAENDYMDLDKARECYDQAVEAKCYKKGEKIPCEVRFRSNLSRPAKACFLMAEKYRTGWTIQYQQETGDYTTWGSPIYKTVTSQVEPNPEAARFLFLIAHKKGHPSAGNQLKLVKDGPAHNTQVSIRNNEYRETITEARKYENGTGVAKDLNKALRMRGGGLRFFTQPIKIHPCAMGRRL